MVINDVKGTPNSNNRYSNKIVTPSDAKIMLYVYRIVLTTSTRNRGHYIIQEYYVYVSQPLYFPARFKFIQVQLKQGHVKLWKIMLLL